VKTGKRRVCPRVLALAAAGLAMGQQVPAPGPLTVGQAIQRALKNYPSVRVSQEQINAAFDKSGHNVQQLLLDLTQTPAFQYLP